MQNLLVQVVIVALVVRCAVSQSCRLDTDGNAVNTEVLILGAGISGIAAARTLEVNGVDFLVIEATDRIGGRIREYDGIDKVGLEVGANWIQGLDKKAPELHPIWREWLECDSDGPNGNFTPDCFTHVYNEAGNELDIGEYENIKKDFDMALSNADDFGKRIDISEDKSLEEALSMEGWDPNPRTPLDELVEWEGVDFCSAIHPRDISVFHSSRITYDEDFLEDKTVENSPGCDDKRDSVNYLMADEKGYSYVVDCLARNFKDNLRLNSKITKIKTANDCVCVTVEENDLYCGNYAIITFSIGALQASIRGDESSVQFEPSLPEWKQKALNTSIPVHYGKIHLQFDDPFWNDMFNDNDDQQIILGHASEERGNYPYFILDKNRPKTITADVTEDLAIKVAEQDKTQTVSEVMAVLRKILGENIPEPRNAAISDWSIDPLFLCTFSVLPPEAPDNIYDELLKPVDRLYFAGEALNDTNSGFTQGGYGSGVNVTEKVIQKMNSSVNGLSAGAIVGIVVGALLLIDLS